MLPVGAMFAVAAVFTGGAIVGMEINFFGAYSASCSLPWSKFAAVFRKTFHGIYFRLKI